MAKYAIVIRSLAAANYEIAVEVEAISPVVALQKACATLSGECPKEGLFEID